MEPLCRGTLLFTPLAHLKAVKDLTPGSLADVFFLLSSLANFLMENLQIHRESWEIVTSVSVP